MAPITLMGECDVMFKGSKLTTYVPSPHMGELSYRISQSPTPENKNGYFVGYQKPIGAFEVYFMGVRLFSKL